MAVKNVRAWSLLRESGYPVTHLCLERIIVVPVAWLLFVKQTILMDARQHNTTPCRPYNRSVRTNERTRPYLGLLVTFKYDALLAYCI